MNNPIAQVSFAFDNYDGFQSRLAWNINDLAEAEEIQALLMRRMGTPNDAWRKLIWSNAMGDKIYQAVCGNWAYIVTDEVDEARLYQMSLDEDLCPVTMDRAERFTRVYADYDIADPVYEAQRIAQRWANAEVSVR